MFTGIITSLGTVRQITAHASGRTLVIASDYPPENLTPGASIAHDGCCLTVTEAGQDGWGYWHRVDVSSHTLAATTLGSWEQGQRVNLERSLKAGDELGGHLVSGHVDATATLEASTPEGNVRHERMRAPEALACYLAPKGAVTLDGMSLTVTWVAGARFGLTLIPHTLQATNWQYKRVGEPANLEVDMLARYAVRALEAWSPPLAGPT